MNAEQIKEWEAILLLVIMIELTFFILVVLVIKLMEGMNLSQEPIYYLRNCSNFTLYPEGCQVLS
jgi:hypothetical protein